MSLEKEQNFPFEVWPSERLWEVILLTIGTSNAGEELGLEVSAFSYGKEIAKKVVEKVYKMKTEIFPLVERLHRGEENFYQVFAQLDQRLWSLGFRNPYEENLAKGDCCLLFLNLLKKGIPLEIFLASTYFAPQVNDVDYLFRCIQLAEVEKESGKINPIWKKEEQEISIRPLYPNQRRVIKILQRRMGF